jgi:WD repeat-containing protein 35
MNQTLEGHNGTVMCLAWNPTYKKLTTSDEKGLIIVWVLHKGMWYEEMINNRNKSVVMDMKWTPDGKKICIIYEDGAVIVGSVDGNRLWGKELNLPLRRVEWSPDARYIIFITADAEAFIFDSEGTRVKTMTLVALQGMESHSAEETSIVGIDWFSNSLRFTRSVMSDGGQNLCIAFDNGIAQISRGDDDNDPIIIDTELGIKSCKWSPDGSVIAFIGGQLKPANATSTSKRSSSTGKEATSSERSTNYIKFYSGSGVFLRQVRIPGDEINSITWESSGLRIGLAVDAFIFFANVRMSYLWTYLHNTVIYSYYRPERKESVLVFWDLTSGETYLKYVTQLEFLVAAGDHCALVLCDSNASSSSSLASSGGGGGVGSGTSTGRKGSTRRGGTSEDYTVQLRNSVGAIIHTRKLPFQPKYVSMGANHFMAANDRTVYVWQFQTGGTSDQLLSSSNTSAGTSASTGRGSTSKERIFDIETIAYSQVQTLETFKLSSEAVLNPIVCVTVSDKYLMVGRKSGLITRFTLPHLSAENEYYTSSGVEPFRLELSCYSTKLGIIDASGVFTMIDLDARPQHSQGGGGGSGAGDPIDPERSHDDTETNKTNGGGTPTSAEPIKGAGQKLKVERRDVWDMKWAEDNDELICIMEKTKLQVFHGEIAEEPITSSGYLCRFQNLEIRSVILDEILKQPIEQQPQPPSRDLVIDFESKSLREVREKITNEGLSAGYTIAEKTPHPRLYRLIAETALEALDLTMAEKSFVKCGDYHAIQLVRQLREMMIDKMKARAEVAVYLKKYDDAEAVYREIDRKDLAIQMRKRICDYPRVVQLLQTGGGNDQLMREAWDKIAEQYADRFKWKKAAQYFKQSRNLDRLIDCLYRLEMFQELAELRADVPDGTPLLQSLALKFSNLGMHEEAVDCYIR